MILIARYDNLTTSRPLLTVAATWQLPAFSWYFFSSSASIFCRSSAFIFICCCAWLLEFVQKISLVNLPRSRLKWRCRFLTDDIFTLTETNIASGKRPSQRKLVFQASISRCELLVSGKGKWSILKLYKSIPRKSTNVDLASWYNLSGMMVPTLPEGQNAGIIML